jgi:hypothetical protein
LLAPRSGEEPQVEDRPARRAMGGHLYALDFDGVLCDSCGESSLSAVKVSSYPLLVFLPHVVPLAISKRTGFSVQTQFHEHQRIRDLF